MSYYRPPKTSSLLVWAGRAAAITGLALGINSSMGTLPAISTDLASLAPLGAKAFSVLDNAWPLLLGAGGSLAVWRNTEKAAEVNRDTNGYLRESRRALAEGKSEAHLPERMLDKTRQASGLATFMGKAISVIAVLLGVPTLLASPPAGAALIASGIIGWRVSRVAEEARDFAWSTEAAAERGRIAEAKERTVSQARAVSAEPAHAPALGAHGYGYDRGLATKSLSSGNTYTERLMNERGSTAQVTQI